MSTSSVPVPASAAGCGVPGPNWRRGGGRSLRIVASLAADSTLTLRLNDGPAVAGNAPGLIPRQPQEEFCPGHDSGAPVAVYADQESFRRGLTGLKVMSP